MTIPSFVDPEMKRYLLLLWVFTLTLVTLAVGIPQVTVIHVGRERGNSSANAESPKPCRIQSVGNQLRCTVPAGYNVRSGDCPGNHIWSLYRDRTTLTECARLCSSSSQCQAFMFYNNHRCFPKTKTCGTTRKTNPLNVFYDKAPSGYTMRPGDCPGNDIWRLYRDRVTRQRCDSSSRFAIQVQLAMHSCITTTIGVTLRGKGVVKQVSATASTFSTTKYLQVTP